MVKKTQEADVLLIFAPPSVYIPSDEWGSYLLALSPPVGIAYLAAYLLNEGLTVSVLDGAVMAANGESLKQAIAQHKPKLIGISSVTMNARNSLRVAEYVRQIHPQVPIVAGGPHPSFEYEEFLDSNCVDVVVRFEGERTLGELAASLVGCDASKIKYEDLEKVSGIAFRLNGKTIVTRERPLMRDLDDLPLPARTLLRLDQYRAPGIILTGRGCPFQCLFCAAGPISGRRYRKHSIKRVIDEVLDCTENHRIKSLFFADDCFTYNKQRAIGICAALKDLPRPVQWVCEGRVDTVDTELLQAMKNAGCIGIQFGIESGAQIILDHLRKGITIEQIRKSVALAANLGLRTELSMQIGHPEDTEATIKQTLKFANELRSLSQFPGQVKADFAISTPLPGTALREQAAELGIEILTNDWDRYTFIEPVINTRHMTAAQLSRFSLETMFGHLNTKDMVLQRGGR